MNAGQLDPECAWLMLALQFIARTRDFWFGSSGAMRGL
jgi:hypothetical protein